MFVMFGKVYPFLKELRGKPDDPDAFGDVEAEIMRTKWGRGRLKFIMKRIEMWREKAANKTEAGGKRT
jgi:hypothetical protein